MKLERENPFSDCFRGRRHQYLPEILSWNLGRLRQGLKLTQAQVAAKAKITASCYSSIERGLRWPELNTLRLIAAALSVNEEFLFTPERIIDLKDYLVDARNKIRALDREIGKLISLAEDD